MKKIFPYLFALIISGCGSYLEEFPVPNASTVSAFSYDIVGEKKLDVNFKNTSIIPTDSAGTSYTWSFGDGKISNEISPSHTYPSYGEYTVKLVLITNEGFVAESTDIIPVYEPVDLDFTLFYMDTDYKIIRGVGLTTLNIPVNVFGAGMAIDQAEGKIYFPADDENLNVHSIKRVNVDGTKMEVVYEKLPSVTNLAIDTLKKDIYWTSRADNAVWKGKMDGSTPPQKIISGLGSPEPIVFFEDKIYFSDVAVPVEGGEKIYRANSSGGQLEVFINGSWGYGMGLDPVNRRLYFGDQGNYDNAADNMIRSVSIDDNTDILPVAELEAIGTNGSRTYGIAIRLNEGKIYWGDRDALKIKSADLDGKNVKSILKAPGKIRGVVLY